MPLAPPRLWFLRTVSIIGLFIPMFWLITLWDFITGQGPSPGAGAQYVFVFMPTMALAMILLAGSSLSHLQLLRADPHSRRPINWIVFGVSSLGFLLLAGYWVFVTVRGAAA